MNQYPFEWFSKHLEKNIPLVSQGSSEPYLLGTGPSDASMYRNYFENSQQRVRLMEKYRTIIDFPFSPEAIASYYTDNITQTFALTMQYFHENQLSKNGKLLRPGQYWNYYAKPTVKGQYFKKDILWFGKLDGSENFPPWIEAYINIDGTKISVPYWDLVSFLENNLNTHKDYQDWIYGDSKRTHKSIKEFIQ
jgi:hypothetical protein